MVPRSRCGRQYPNCRPSTQGNDDGFAAIEPGLNHDIVVLEGTQLDLHDLNLIFGIHHIDLEAALQLDQCLLGDNDRIFELLILRTYPGKLARQQNALRIRERRFQSERAGPLIDRLR